MGMCINKTQWCDRSMNCPDLTDESQNCTCIEDYQFHCAIEDKCISMEKRCDQQIDCQDREDELFCGCGYDEFECANGWCVSSYNVCNGINDCGDSSDETFSHAQCECSEGYFACPVNTTVTDGVDVVVCRRDYAWCDGYSDCPGSTDEQNGCDNECRSSQVSCPTLGTCIEKQWLCDQRRHCPNTTLQLDCECSTYDWQCGNGLCVSYWNLCNGYNDCTDWTDEVNCTCDYNEYSCEYTIDDLNINICKPTSTYCDGHNDCPNGFDELPGCASSCYADQFPCEEKCISESSVCDGIQDCDNNFDELDILCLSLYSLYLTEETEGRVIIAFNGTNGTVCDDYFGDEECQVICRQLGYSGGYDIDVAAGTGPIWLDNLQCVGDEEYLHQCQRNPIGVHNCGHYEDAGCVCSCPPGQWKCHSSRMKHCIDENDVCDGVQHCDYGEDEQWCGSTTLPTAAPTITSIRTTIPVPGGCSLCEFHCYLSSSLQCLSGDRICDSNNDCLYGEDEYDCDYGRGCNAPLVQCVGSRECIHPLQLCDNIPDCPHGEDELYGCQNYSRVTTTTPSYTTPRTRPDINCETNLYEVSGYFASMNFPGQYENNMYCLWYINPGNQYMYIAFTFDAFDVEYERSCRFDSLSLLEIADSKLCGSIAFGTNFSAPLFDGAITVLFSTDSSYTENGFAVSYTAYIEEPYIESWPTGNSSNVTTPIPTHVPTQTTMPTQPSTQTQIPTQDPTQTPSYTTATANETRGCDSEVTVPEGVLYSPFWPSNYLNNMDCYMYFSVGEEYSYIEFVVNEFAVENHATCAYDYIEIGGTRYCGYLLPGMSLVIVSAPRGELAAHFHSDGSSTSSGFSLTYRAFVTYPTIATVAPDPSTATAYTSRSNSSTTQHSTLTTSNSTNTTSPYDCTMGCYECPFSGGSFIRPDEFCNGYRDCPKGEDELFCDCSSACEGFQCYDGSCLPSAYHCDSVSQCSEGEDEHDCGCSGFECFSGDCILSSYVCDGFFDCFWGEDENNCTVCTDDSMYCDNGECVDPSDWCDRTAHCHDSSDEAYGCTCAPGYHECYFDTENFFCASMTSICYGSGLGYCYAAAVNCSCDYKCPNTGVCMRGNYFCDGDNDCFDYSDEVNCNGDSGCGENEFRCRYSLHSDDYYCISSYLVCDGYGQCLYGEDELHCDYQNNDESLEGDFILSEQSDNMTYVGNDVTARGQDVSYNTPSGTVVILGNYLPPGQILESVLFYLNDEQFLDSLLFAKIQVWKHMGDNEFKLRMNVPVKISTYSMGVKKINLTPEEQLKIQDGDIAAIMVMGSFFVSYDVESNVLSNPTVDYFLTLHQGQDIKQGQTMTFQSSSSRNIYSFAVALAQDENHCADNECFRCDDNMMIPLFSRCDFTKDCSDGSDEINCECNLDNIWSGADIFICSSGHCIYASLQCDMNADCPDASDEMSCSHGCNPLIGHHPAYPDYTTDGNYFVCNGSGLCLPYTRVCDGEVDCNCHPDDPDDCIEGADELDCSPQHCSDAEAKFLCENNACINAILVCDFIDHCGDNSDERNCVTDTNQCPHNGWYCPHSDRCLSRDYVCDGYNDCYDVNAQNPVVIDEYLCDNCNLTSQIACANYQCINESQIYDGMMDCSDGSDEASVTISRPPSDPQFELTYRGNGRVLFTLQRAESGTYEAYVPCRDTWTEQLSEMACKQLGHERLLSLEWIDADFNSGISLDGVSVFQPASRRTQSVDGVVVAGHMIASYSQAALTHSIVTGAQFSSWTESLCSSQQVPVIECESKSCGRSSVPPPYTVGNPYVINAEHSAPGAFPHYVSLQTAYSKFPFCGGSIIDKHWVLTAAHCVEDESASDIVLYSRSTVLSSEHGRYNQVTKILSHPLYHDSQGILSYDYALLHVAAGFQFDDYQNQICLPDGNNHVYEDTNCYVAGLGDRFDGWTQDSTRAQLLRHAKMRLYSYHGCLNYMSRVIQNNSHIPNDVHDHIRLINDLHICAASYGYTHSCYGDSGGPLMCKNEHNKWELMGVVSYGLENLDCNGMAIYANVTTIVPWINQMMNLYN